MWDVKEFDPEFFYDPEKGLLPFLSSKVTSLITNEETEKLQELIDDIANTADAMYDMLGQINDKQAKFLEMKEKRSQMEKERKKMLEAMEAIDEEFEKEFGDTSKEKEATKETQKDPSIVSDAFEHMISENISRLSTNKNESANIYKSEHTEDVRDFTEDKKESKQNDVIDDADDIDSAFFDNMIEGLVEKESQEASSSETDEAKDVSILEDASTSFEGDSASSPDSNVDPSLKALMEESLIGIDEVVEKEKTEKATQALEATIENLINSMGKDEEDIEEEEEISLEDELENFINSKSLGGSVSSDPDISQDEEKDAIEEFGNLTLDSVIETKDEDEYLELKESGVVLGDDIDSEIVEFFDEDDDEYGNVDVGIDDGLSSEGEDIDEDDENYNPYSFENIYRRSSRNTTSKASAAFDDEDLADILNQDLSDDIDDSQLDISDEKDYDTEDDLSIDIDTTQLYDGSDDDEDDEEDDDELMGIMDLDDF